MRDKGYVCLYLVLCNVIGREIKWLRPTVYYGIAFAVVNLSKM